MVPWQASQVGIFSRSGENEYRWLLDGLSECSVSPFVITNSNNRLFYDKICKCSFGILYHSQNRGRINITDVTDSLYDDELRTMSEVLGKDQVIVVIDDLVDSGHEAKERILSHQPSLRALTRDIILISTGDKASGARLRPRTETIRSMISKRPRFGRAEVDSGPVKVTIQGHPSSADNLRSSDDAGPGRKGYLKRIVISGLSFVVFWSTYYHPVQRNGALSVLWGAVMYRALCTDVLTPLLWLNSQGPFALSCTITLMTACDTYCRPSAFNAALTVLWITHCSRYFWPRRQRLISRPVRRVISYGLVLLSFWKGWQELDAETTLQIISQLVLRSPLILVADDM